MSADLANMSGRPQMKRTHKPKVNSSSDDVEDDKQHPYAEGHGFVKEELENSINETRKDKKRDPKRNRQADQVKSSRGKRINQFKKIALQYGTVQNIVLIAVVAFFAGAIFQAKFSNWTNSGASCNFTGAREEFKMRMALFEEEFGPQDNYHIKMIRSAIGLVLNDKEPKQPAVIAIMMLDNGTVATNLATRLVDVIGQSVSCNQRHLYIDASKYAANESDDVKEDIDQEIQKHLSDKQLVIIVDHFDRLPDQSPSIFHGLCDDTNASVKRAIYIFIAYVQENAAPSKEVTQFWKGKLTDDKRYSLESRIGGSKIFCYSGKKCGQKICCK